MAFHWKNFEQGQPNHESIGWNKKIWIMFLLRSYWVWVIKMWLITWIADLLYRKTHYFVVNCLRTTTNDCCCNLLFPNGSIDALVRENGMLRAQNSFTLFACVCIWTIATDVNTTAQQAADIQLISLTKRTLSQVHKVNTHEDNSINILILLLLSSLYNEAIFCCYS